MTLLDRIGKILLSGVQVLTGFGPLIRMSFPGMATVESKVEADIAGFSKIISLIQAGLNAPGSGALRMQTAIPMFTQAILQSDLMTGQHIANPDLFNKAAQEYAQATVDLLDSLHPDGVDGKSITK